MNQLLEKLRDASVCAWLLFVQWLNWIAVSAAGFAVAVDAMYHKEVSQAFEAFPPYVKLIALAAWAGMVHYGLRSAKKAA